MARLLYGFTFALLSLTGMALAHGESSQTDLRKLVLCTDVTSVRVTLEEMPAKHRNTRASIERSLLETLTSVLRKSGIRYEPQRTCQASAGFTQLNVNVRYLNPKHYVGFGDPAYSYSIDIRVTPHPKRAGSAMPVRFSAGVADIHSEARTKIPFPSMVSTWGKELTGDLVKAWRKDNR